MAARAWRCRTKLSQSVRGYPCLRPRRTEVINQAWSEKGSLDRTTTASRHWSRRRCCCCNFSCSDRMVRVVAFLIESARRRKTLQTTSARQGRARRGLRVGVGGGGGPCAVGGGPINRWEQGVKEFRYLFTKRPHAPVASGRKGTCLPVVLSREAKRCNGVKRSAFERKINRKIHFECLESELDEKSVLGGCGKTETSQEYRMQPKRGGDGSSLKSKYIIPKNGSTSWRNDTSTENGLVTWQSDCTLHCR